MKLIHKILSLILKKEETIVEKVCKELGITQNELAELLEIPSLNIYQLTKGNFSSLIKIQLEQLIINHKDINKKNTCINKIKTLIQLEKFSS
ncbi:transcriptional regulator [Aliarcobacter butzleri]|uniref:transcriptional regulator n=1 Tax=Aliarcobacter butzleri TaxID=28197 RepID=UPI0021B66DDA|nr:transcriptional regulator [Aliarcobacter butzleri]MCT7643863.1 transcriptional regulator [Aliarcobacter butzleri]